MYKIQKMIKRKVEPIENLCDEVQTVNGFCYLEDRLNMAGGYDAAVTIIREADKSRPLKCCKHSKKCIEHPKKQPTTQKKCEFSKTEIKFPGSIIRHKQLAFHSI